MEGNYLHLTKQAVLSCFLSRGPEASKAHEKLQQASVKRSKAQVKNSSPEATLKHPALGGGREGIQVH